MKQFFNQIQVNWYSRKIIIKYLVLDERLEDFILTKFDQKQTNKPNIIEQLGQSMSEAGNDFGPSTQYGMRN